MKSPHCLLCDEQGHYAYQCFRRYKKPLVATKRLKRSGKHHRLWQAAKRKWFKENTKKVYVCYICGKGVDRANITLDHILPRSNRPDLRYEQSNLAPVHWLCNNQKGSRHGEAYTPQTLRPLSD